MKQILVLIDDDADDREIFYEGVKDIDPNLICVTASGLKQALIELNSSAPSLPDVFFLDVNMPAISGWQCLTELKENDDYRKIPVIMYSTSNHDQDKLRAKELGALGLLSKPSDFKILKSILAEITQHIENRTLTEENFQALIRKYHSRL